ncbi:MAG: hypothetical protein GXZ15_04310 [Campylobacter sp.]|nr:hypothetical protein [Campylobacter sp.]
MFVRIFTLFLICVNLLFSQILKPTYYEITPQSKTLLTLDIQDKVILSKLFEDGNFSQDIGKYEIKDDILKITFDDENSKIYKVENGQISLINDQNTTTNKTLKLIDENYYKSYLGKYSNHHGTVIIQVSDVEKLSFEFYPKFKNKACEISTQELSFDDGLIIADGIVINLLNPNSIYINSRICPEISGIYSGGKKHKYTITRHSLGLLHKGITPREILNYLPKDQIFKDGDKIVIKSQKNKALFSFSSKDDIDYDTPKNLEILNDIYKTPNNIGLGSTYSEVKRSIYIDSKEQEGDFIKLKNEFLNLSFYFKNSEIEQNDEDAKVSKLILEW